MGRVRTAPGGICGAAGESSGIGSLTTPYARGVSAGVVGQAVVLFAVTNIDDMLVLALFFGKGAGHRGSSGRILVGQYLGFGAILCVSVAAALGATFLPESAVPYLGLLPLGLGVREAWRVWTRRNHDTAVDAPKSEGGGPRVLEVAAVTFANGGDNIGVYVPVFATAGAAGLGVYAFVFLILVGIWVAIGRYFATRPLVAKSLSRWGHVLLPIVLIGIGLLILIDGGAFGL